MRFEGRQQPTTTWLRAQLANAPQPDVSAQQVRNRAAQILRPPGAMSRLDEIAAWVAGWQASSAPEITEPVVIVFTGDHGVVAEGVSAFPSTVNAEMMSAFNKGEASISSIGRTVGAQVFAIDTGSAAPQEI